MPKKYVCPLCLGSDFRPLCDVGTREIHHCAGCDLRFVPPIFHLSVDEERRRYLCHDNSFQDTEYIAYLNRCIKDLSRIPVEHPQVLDFGCGQHGVLSDILNKQGVHCTAYDPLFCIGPNALDQKYDIVILNEVIEHLRDPRHELMRLSNIARFMLIRTRLVTPLTDIASWWYVQDPTHIAFYSTRSITVAAELMGRQILFCDKEFVAVVG